MRSTQSTIEAMHRLAELVGWTVESSGRAWRIVDADVEPELYEGITFDKRAMVAMLARIYAWRTGTPLPDVPAVIKWRPRYVFLPKMALYVLDTTGMDASTEATLTRMFPPRKEVP